MELSRNQTRQSGVELLKILGMLLIVIGHVTQTLDSPNSHVPFQEYFLGNIAEVTQNPVRLLMGGLMYGGALGNNIFFFCSAWFLLDKKEGSVRKIPRLMSDVWAISVLMLLAFVVWLRRNISGALLVRQFFPNILSNNWYLTCYMLFLPIYPALNEIISRFDRKSLFYAIEFLFALTVIFCRYTFAQWVMFYFFIAYMKYYLKDFSASVKRNLVLLALGVIGIAVSIITFNALGLRYAFLAGILPRLRQMYNPFVILTATSLLNLARQIPVQSRTVNYVARMTMFIYLIHQNMLVRDYLRPWIWQKIYTGGVQPHYFVHFHLFRRAFPVLPRVERALCDFPAKSRMAHER